ncbi:hypothetical protein [uncultured Winogradskyella sp.]|uniref:hypothetical protein n=1 Tax=Winogradskyella sp. 4-2091 TaxID=3381659 RepID=UPI0026335C29|nr:hypothetical protein [uncultured Winogradskyella sp.]
MSDKTETLFAIYKNDIHLGNEKGKTVNDAIKNYLKAALFQESLNDSEFISLYKGRVAIKDIHF